jgi:hypothetical protein
MAQILGANEVLTHQILSPARILLSVALALVACSPMNPDRNAVIELSESKLPSKQQSSLRGTSWLLLGYDSFESSSERETPAPGEVHRVSFEPNGTLVVQLACNRGTGRWTASQREADRGSVEIGPIPIARTPCPGTRMNRVADDLEYVGSYVIGADGRLTLNLRADSGNLVWERVK